MPCLSITGFYPDDKKDDPIQFEIYIKDTKQKEALAQITETNPLSKIEKVLNIKFPDGLEYYIGACAD